MKPNQKANDKDSAAGARRRRWFRVIAIAVPLVNLLLIEFVLRAVGFGYPTGFFLKTQVNGQPVFIENQQFSKRYFPPGLERTPQPTIFPAAKPPGTVRIFVLGESAAMGDPEPAFGFPRVLETLLREALPGKRIEVINVAVTAINSHVIREIAKDCADKQGDYWIVYMGNNEVVGPFGAGTVFGEQTPGLAFIRANLALKSTRLGQLFDALRHKLTGKSGTPTSWEGMEMFLKQQVALNDPRLAKVYSHFEANLRDIISLGENSGAKVLLGTVASNLKDCPPFASLHRKNLTDTQKADWDKLFQAGIEDERAGRHFIALTNFQNAARIDATYGELWYRAGQTQMALGDNAAARVFLELARECDALRFRADTRINQIIRHQGTNRLGPPFIDLEETLARQSPREITGEEFFYEHVHFNFAGNYAVARAFAERILSSTNIVLLTEAECAARLAFTDFDQHRVLDEVRQRLQQPPFSTQLDHDARDQRLRQQLARLDRASLSNALHTYEQAIARAPEDPVLHENFATLLQDFDRPQEAEQQWRKVLQLLPHSEHALFTLANLLDGEGRSAEALPFYREALRRKPEGFEARSGLALALGNLGRTAESIAEYERLIRLKPNFAEARVNLGQAFAQQGRANEATAQYIEAIRIQSNNVPARVNLGKLLAAEGKYREAAGHYQEALRINPTNAIAHFNLGNALSALGDAAGATSHFAEAVRHNPKFAEAHYNLGLGFAKQGRNAEALTHLAEAARLKPGFTEAQFNLGVALAKARRFEEAVACFNITLRLDPNHALAKKFLEQAQGMKGL